MQFKKIAFVLLLLLLQSYVEEPKDIAIYKLKIVSAESFLNENPSIERKAIVDFIVHQFDDQHKVSQQKLDELWLNKNARETLHLMRFQIINQKLYADSFNLRHVYFPPIFIYLQKFLENYKVQDVDFIIHARDEIPINSGVEDKLLKIPSFMMSKDLTTSYEKEKLLFPDSFLLKESWGKLLDQIKQANNYYPWPEKNNKIFWRGATSGGMYEIQNFDKLPRLSLVMLSKLYPDLIDAQFTLLTPWFDTANSTKLKEVIEIIFGKERQMVSEENHLKYKYLASIDGFTCAWSRVPWIMYSNSVLLKQDSSKIEWFYAPIKPYVHYVPVNKNLSNIFDKLEWMKNHDQELQQISQNAHNFVANNLMPEHIEANIAIILNEYAKLQEDKEIRETLPPADDVYSIPFLVKRIIKNYFSKE